MDPLQASILMPSGAQASDTNAKCVYSTDYLPRLVRSTPLRLAGQSAVKI